MKQGLLIILSGPSGVGKGVLRRKLMKDKDLDLIFSISMTTRPRRIKETNGKDYFFVSEDEFKQRIEKNDFIEYVEYCGHYYGTPKSFVDEMLSEGKNVLLEIEVAGATQVMKQYRGMYTLAVFLLPPDLRELERRIRLRNSETDDEIANRIAKAQEEMKLKDDYDVCLTNYTVKKTALRFKQAVLNRLKYIEAVENGQEVSKDYIIKRP